MANLQVKGMDDSLSDQLKRQSAMAWFGANLHLRWYEDER